MNKQEVRQLLSASLTPESASLQPPTAEEWGALEDLLEMRFPIAFRYFIELMSEFQFPGDIYNVPQSGRTNGNDTIDRVYLQEVQSSCWPVELIPFYGMGNGDYFALRREGGVASGVYYWYHERRAAEVYSPTFDLWLLHLSEFLSGG
jgi:SMI1-KNR4 cell-wall